MRAADAFLLLAPEGIPKAHVFQRVHATRGGLLPGNWPQLGPQLER